MPKFAVNIPGLASEIEADSVDHAKQLIRQATRTPEAITPGRRPLVPEAGQELFRGEVKHLSNLQDFVNEFTLGSGPVNAPTFQQLLGTQDPSTPIGEAAEIGGFGPGAILAGALGRLGREISPLFEFFGTVLGGFAGTPNSFRVPRTDAEKMLARSGIEGVGTPSVLSDNPLVRIASKTVESLLQRIPGSHPVITAAQNRLRDAFQDQLRIRTLPKDFEQLGRGLQRGLKGTLARRKEVENTLWRGLPDKLPPNFQFNTARLTARAQDLLRREFPQRFLSDRMSWDEIKELRTAVGKELESVSRAGRYTKGQLDDLGSLYDDIATDMRSAAKFGGFENEFDRANKFTKALHTRVKDVINPLLFQGKRKDRPLFPTETAQKTIKAKEVERIRAIRRSMPREDWKEYAESQIRVMGEDINGEFSLQRFLNNYNSLQGPGRGRKFIETLFGGLSKDDVVLRRLDELASSAALIIARSPLTRSDDTGGLVGVGTLAAGAAQLATGRIGGATLTLTAPAAVAKILTSPTIMRTAGNLFTLSPTRRGQQAAEIITSPALGPTLMRLAAAQGTTLEEKEALLSFMDVLQAHAPVPTNFTPPLPPAPQ